MEVVLSLAFEAVLFKLCVTYNHTTMGISKSHSDFLKNIVAASKCQVGMFRSIGHCVALCPFSQDRVVFSLHCVHLILYCGPPMPVCKQDTTGEASSDVDMLLGQHSV